MGRPSDKEIGPPPSEAAVDEGRPGRVVVDNRGRNVWQWAKKAALDSTSILIKRLENTDLALEPTQRVPVVPNAPPGKPQVPASAKTAAKPTEGRLGHKANPADARSQKPAKPAEPARGARRVADSGGGFDPYNSR
jgi:hypothetical protein